MTTLRRSFLVLALGLALPASAAEKAVEIEATPAQLNAVRAMGGDVVFFTSARQPLRRLSDLRQPQREVASPHLGLARGLMGLLRAGGVPLDPSAAELMTLVGVHHLPRIFAGGVRLVMVRAAEAPLVAGGVPLVFRGPGGEVVGAVDANTKAAPAGDPRDTSFGPVVSAQRGATARARKTDQIAVETLSARPGQQFLVVTIARDFGRGAGAVSFLYGSGIIVEPAFERLQLEVGGRRLPPRAINANGLTLELGYEIPAGAKGARLVDGEARVDLEATGG
jgi:hypothetical protein